MLDRPARGLFPMDTHSNIHRSFPTIENHADQILSRNSPDAFSATSARLSRRTTNSTPSHISKQLAS